MLSVSASFSFLYSHPSFLLSIPFRSDLEVSGVVKLERERIGKRRCCSEIYCGFLSLSLSLARSLPLSYSLYTHLSFSLFLSLHLFSLFLAQSLNLSLSVFYLVVAGFKYDSKTNQFYTSRTAIHQI
jgi:hypothetical protein